jgi:ComF family protein
MRLDDRALRGGCRTMVAQRAAHYRMLSNVREAKFDILAAWCTRATSHVGRDVRHALQRALPQACVLCKAPSGDALVCDGCSSDMPRIADACPRCALPSQDNLACGACLAKPPPFDTAIAAWRYAFPADRLLQAFKYAGTLALAEPFAAAVAESLRMRNAVMPDCVIAMPLSQRRQRERGFNHAHEIARRLSSHVDVPLANALWRTRDAPPQAGLTLRERMRNVRDAFDAGTSVAGLAVAIVDDVMTTGATIGAAARALRRAGAVRIDAWVVARTVRDQGSGIGYQGSELPLADIGGILADTDA